MLRSTLLRVLCLTTPLYQATFAEDTAPTAPNPWEGAIRAFEEEDKANPPAPGQVLFLGSSSIAAWDIEEAFPDLDVLKRGFGGSMIADSVYFFERVVAPYQPRAIVFYAGDNDVAAGKTAEQVADDFRTFVSRVRETLPDTTLLYLPIKPSIARWELWPTMKDANGQIAALSEKDPLLEYVDVATPMLGEDGKPRADLLIEDGLHLSEKGYALWSEILKPYLDNLPKMGTPETETVRASD